MTDLIGRFQRCVEDDFDTTYDIYYIDRLTGREVLRYDGADPANTKASHGATSDKDEMAKLGYDLDEEIDISKVHATIKVSLVEVERHKLLKERRLKREKEEAEATELLSFLGDDAKDFSFEKYYDGEHDILAPALEKRRYRNISFYMIEEDSFGPLIRGCRAIDPNGNTVRFFYG